MAEEPSIRTTSAKLDAIRAFEAAGFALIPLCSPTEPHAHSGKNCEPSSMGKAPVTAHFLSTKPGTHKPEDLAVGNWGIVLPDTVVVVDVDPRNFAAGDNPLVRLSRDVGGLKSFTVGSGSGGLHLYFKVPAGKKFVNTLGTYSGVEFKSRGRQMVGPGSLHAISGKMYQIVSGSPAEMAPLPAKLLAMIEKQAETQIPTKGTGAYVDDDATQARYKEYLEKQAPISGTFAVACRGRDFGLSPVCTLRLLWTVWNPRRVAPRTEAELRDRVAHAYKYASGKVGSENPAADFEPVAEQEKPDALNERPQDAKIVWEQDGHQRLKRTFLNLLNFLRDENAGFFKIFAFNELSGRPEFVSPAPWHRNVLPKSPGVTDQDLMLLKGHLAQRYKFEMSVPAIAEAVVNVAYHARFHPVREYLDGLKWDGVKRLDNWMRDYLGAVDNDYTRAVARKVLCAAVMRVQRPGIKFDHVVVLEGVQDLGKSTVVDVLGGDWASDAPVDPHSRDTVDAMQGRWLIEMAEMEVLRKTDEDALKAFITRRTDRVRLAYGRATVDLPRQSIFIATKNPRADGTYLKDDTGNRRWWPVRCHGLEKCGGQVDFKGLTKARDQLFAEAMVLCAGTEREELFMETKALKTAAAAEAAERHAQHEWTERISAWIAELDRKPETKRNTLSVRDVWIEAMGGADSRIDQRSVRAITSILRDLGWHSEVRRMHGRGDGGVGIGVPHRVWVREEVFDVLDGL